MNLRLKNTVLGEERDRFEREKGEEREKNE
jgi:hypothetical protein